MNIFSLFGGAARALSLGAIMLGGAGQAARAADAASAYGISELRLGLFSHDPFSHEAGALSVKGEVLFDVWTKDKDSVLSVFTPRVLVGGSSSFQRGKTNLINAGFAWTYDVTKAVFLELTFGGSLHDGSTSFERPPGRAAMGCHFAFHESASAGYRLDANWSVMATVEHASNGGLCDKNNGLSNFGLKVGYSF